MKEITERQDIIESKRKSSKESQIYNKAITTGNQFYEIFLQDPSAIVPDAAENQEMMEFLSAMKGDQKKAIAVKKLFEETLHNNMMKELGHKAELELEHDFHKMKKDLTPALLKDVIARPDSYPFLEADTVSHIKSLDKAGRKAFHEEFNELHKNDSITTDNVHHSKLRDFLESIWHKDILPILKCVLPVLEQLAIMAVQYSTSALAQIVHEGVPGAIGDTLAGGIEKVGKAVERKIDEKFDAFLAADTEGLSLHDTSDNVLSIGILGNPADVPINDTSY